MYKVKERYEKIVAQYPTYSSYTAFAETIRDTNLSERVVRHWFNRLVDREDYAKNEGPAVLRYLLSIAQRDSPITPSGKV